MSVSGYWRVTKADGTTTVVHLSPAGDLERLKLHYPGCIGKAITKEEFMAWKGRVAAVIA